MRFTVDDAVVVSLPGASERREHMTAMMPRLGFRPRFIDAVDGTTVEPPNYWKASPQAYANAQTHRRILAGTKGSVAVFEDDAWVAGDFFARLTTVVEAAPDWELILLGGEMLSMPTRHAPGVLRVRSAGRSIAYIARGRARQFMIQAIDRSSTHWDNEWSTVMGTLNTFAPDPFIVTPSGHESTIPDSTPYLNSRGSGGN